MPAPRTIAAIDAGSNAIRAVVGAVMGRDEIMRLESERIPVRLGHNAFTRGELDTETIDAAVAAFARFRKLFDYHGVQRYRAVATSATRTVRNRELLLHRIHYETGIDLEVIDGEEEIRLVRLAISDAFGEDAAPPTLLDLGGGSLEIGTQRDGVWSSVSLPIGTVRLMETFDLYGPIGESETKMLRRYIGTVMDAHGVESFATSIREGVATGGNADALAGLFGKSNANGMNVIDFDTLQKASDEILKLSVPERIQEYGVREDRAEVMGIASLAFLEAMSRAELESYVAPDVGVREGLELELSREITDETQATLTINSALAGALRVYMARLGHDSGHGEQVRSLAVQLFDELKSIHGLDDHARLVLELAALVHDVGEVVNRKKHHRHTEYLLLYGRVPGLESPLREQVAALARAHRKSLPKASKHDAYSELSEGERDMIDKLVPFIRIADALDTDHRHLVRRIEAQTSDDEVLLKLHIKHKVGITSATFERRNHIFSNEYNLPISMEIVE